MIADSDLKKTAAPASPGATSTTLDPETTMDFDVPTATDDDQQHKTSVAGYWEQEFRRRSIIRGASGVDLGLDTDYSTDNNVSVDDEASTEEEAIDDAKAASLVQVNETLNMLLDEGEGKTAKDEKMRLANPGATSIAKGGEESLPCKDEKVDSKTYAALSMSGEIVTKPGALRSASSKVIDGKETPKAGTPSLLERSQAPSIPGVVRERGPAFNGVSQEFSVNDTEEAATRSKIFELASKNDLEAGHHNSPIEAKKVEEETIAYAEKDTSGKKLKLMVAGIFVLVAVFVVTLSIVLTRDDSEEDDGIDPRCKKPLENLTIAEHCLCYNTTEAVWEDMTEVERWRFYDNIEYGKSVGSISQDFTAEPEDCSPEALAFTQLALQARIEGIDPNEKYALKASQPLLAEGYAILILYFKMGGLDWRVQGGWLDPNTSLHDFLGVDLFFFGSITTVELPNMNLVGSIPSEILLLQKLRRLDLSGNPGITGTIPEELCTLKNLDSISISKTGLEGSLPDCLSNLRQLDSLDLHKNQLTGTIPDGLFVPQLQVLDLSGNQLNGTIPSSISNSTRLQSLQLQANQLSGTLPVSMESLQELSELNIGVNSFTGEVPPFLARFGLLDFASLLDSGFHGAIPESYCEDIPTEEFTALSRQRQIVIRCFEDEVGEGQPIFPTCSCCANPQAVVVLCSEQFPPELIKRFIDNDL